MIIHQLILLFGLIIIGYITNKVNILDTAANQKISKFIINITIPATIINSSIGQKTEDGNKVIIVFIVAIIFYIVMPFISYLFAKLLKQSPTFELMLTYSNLGFMGIPIVSALFGESIVFYVTIFMMIFNISIFSQGILTLSKGSYSKKIKFEFKNILNPGIMCAIVAIAIFILQIPVQSDVKNLISSISSITTPLAMIVIGSTLAEIPLKQVFSDYKMYIFSIIKLGIYPLLVYLILSLFIQDSQIVGVAVILASLPTAGNVSMVCSEYNGDMTMVTKGICISTLFSVIAIPIWINIVI